MAKPSGRPKRYPRELLGDVLWAFSRPRFRSLARFDAAVRAYYREMNWEFDWQPDEVVLNSRRVRVRPDFWDSVLEEQAEGVVTELTADSPSGFTAGELLFKVHNTFLREWGEEAGDHIFFEGMTLVEAPGGRTSPLYEINLGSSW